MSNIVYRRSRELAMTMAINWGWAVVHQDEVDQEILQVMQDLYGVVATPYESRLILWPVGIDSERKEEIKLLVKKGEMEERTRPPVKVETVPSER